MRQLRRTTKFDSKVREEHAKNALKKNRERAAQFITWFVWHTAFVIPHNKQFHLIKIRVPSDDPSDIDGTKMVRAIYEIKPQLVHWGSHLFKFSVKTVETKLATDDDENIFKMDD